MEIRLKDLLAERNLSVTEFADMCDLPSETVKNVYYGRTKDPKLSTVVKMAETLDISINCFIGKCPHNTAESRILRNYSMCGRHGKSIIEFVARYEATAAKSERDADEKHKVPCLIPYGNIIYGIIYETCETVEIETSVKDAFSAVKITNNDLAPAYCRDDIILFENRFPHNGEYAAFFREDRAYILQYIEEGDHYRLKSLNSQGEDIILKRMDEIGFIGTCIDVIRS